MIAPLSALLAAVEDQLPPELVPPAALRRLKARAEEIPSAWASAVVEVRLAESSQVDLIVCANQGDGGQRELARIGPAAARAFGAARSVLEAWTDEHHPLSSQVPVFWLEYDLPDPRPPREPDPFAFICLRPDCLAPVYPQAPRGAPPSAEETRALAELGLRATGVSPSPAAMALLERCAAALPPHGRLFHVVQRPQPNSRDVRVGAVLPTEAVRSWLEEIGWSGPEKNLQTLMRLVGEGWSMLHVQVELSSEGVRPQLSIDYNRLDGFDWDRVGDELVRAGAALPQKAAAAPRWIGTQPFSFAGAAWRAVLDRRLFYKLTSKADGALEAKAYLCLQPRYVLF